MKLDDVVRDIEMSYEVLFAFWALHGDDADADLPAAWAAARDQVRAAIIKYTQGDGA